MPGTAFSLFIFSNIKKVYLEILKYLEHFFCLFPFSNIEKVSLQILQYLVELFCLFFFSNIKKKNTYKSWNNVFLIRVFKYKKIFFTNPSTIFCLFPF